MEFYFLATSMVISGQVLTCDSTYSWWLQAASIMTRYPTQSHYPDTELINPCPISIMPSAKLGIDKYKFGKLLIRLDRESNCSVLYRFGYCNSSYEDGHWFVTMHTHGDFIMLQDLGTRPPHVITWSPPQSHYPDIEQTTLCSILIMPHDRLGSAK